MFSYLIFLEGATTPVYVPELDRCVPLNRCTHWQLLNLDVDTVCNLTEAVRIHAGLPDNSLIDEHLKVNFLSCITIR